MFLHEKSIFLGQLFFITRKAHYFSDLFSILRLVVISDKKKINVFSSPKKSEFKKIHTCTTKSSKAIISPRNIISKWKKVF